MKRVISTSRLVFLFSHVILIARASAEVSEGLKNAINSHSQRFREARRLNVTTQNIQSQPGQGLGSFDDTSVGWCGAAQTNIPAGSGTFFAIDNAQWTVPNIRLPPDANGQPVFGVAAWAGIDGTGSCTGVILQAGTVSYMEMDNSGNYNTNVKVWAQWYPASPAYPTIDVSTGHTVQVSILATSTSQADIQITNLNNGEQVSVPLQSPGDAYNLCGLSVEYVVGVPTAAGAGTPLPQFDEFLFGNCIAETTLGSTVDLTGASSLTLKNQNGAVLATSNIVNGNEVQVTYVSSRLSKG